jgi:hypothetical protein
MLLGVSRVFLKNLSKTKTPGVGEGGVPQTSQVCLGVCSTLEFVYVLFPGQTDTSPPPKTPATTGQQVEQVFSQTTPMASTTKEQQPILTPQRVQGIPTAPRKYLVHNSGEEGHARVCALLGAEMITTDGTKFYNRYNMPHKFSATKANYRAVGLAVNNAYTHVGAVFFNKDLMSAKNMNATKDPSAKNQDRLRLCVTTRKGVTNGHGNTALKRMDFPVPEHTSKKIRAEFTVTKTVTTKKGTDTAKEHKVVRTVTRNATITCNNFATLMKRVTSMIGTQFASPNGYSGVVFRQGTPYSISDPLSWALIPYDAEVFFVDPLTVVGAAPFPLQNADPKSIFALAEKAYHGHMRSKHRAAESQSPERDGSK